MSDKTHKASLIRRLLDKLYPPHEEIAIYSAAVGLIALAITSHGFRDAMSFIAVALLVEFPSEGFETSIWKGIWNTFGGVTLVIVSMASLLISLYLPFTRRRLDPFIEFMIVVHVLLIFASNVIAFQENQNVFTVVLFFVSFLYFFVFSVGHRFRFLQIKVSEHQASARQGYIAAAAVSFLVAILSLGFKMHWAHCYALATAFAVVMAKILDTSAA